jgi:hypothetical protein
VIAKVVLARAIAVPAAATATVATTGSGLVDVQEGGRDGQRIVLPVPLLLAEVAASFVPERARPRAREATRHHAFRGPGACGPARRTDGEYVRVEEDTSRS